MYRQIDQRELNKSEQLFRHLYDSIRRGELANGARLASEAELARNHNCSRITVRSSLRQLQELKLIRRVRGDGTYISSEDVRFSNRRSIALIANDVYNGVYQEIDPYFSYLMRGLLQGGNKLDFSANFIVMQRNDADFMETFERQQIKLGDYDGLIFTKQLTVPELNALERNHCRFISLQAPADNREISYVAIDNFTGAYVATRHLIDRGRRNLIFLHGSPDIKINREKLHGFNQALDEAGLDLSPNGRRHYEIDPAAEEGAAEIIRRLMAEKQSFDGVIVHGDWATIGAVGALREAGLRIPQDVSLVMYDDHPIASRVLKMGITAVRQPYTEQLRCGLEMLLRDLSRLSMSNTIQIIQPALMVRETS